MKILVVDDEQSIRAMICEYAEYEGYEIDEAEDGMEAVAMVKETDYDLIILDIMMPKMDGFSTCKEIKKIRKVPVIMLSARGEEYDKLFGFEVGADDYVCKPFSPKELMVRVKLVARRRAPIPEPIAIAEYDGLKLDFSGREVYANGRKLQLTPKEYDLLFFLAKNKNVALSREKLLEEVWGYDFYGDDRTVDTHIKMLRNNLGEYRKMVITLRGMGYKFDSTALETEENEAEN